MFKHILIPTDGSEASLRAVEKGVAMARQLGAEVTLMTAVEHLPAGMAAFHADETPFHQAVVEAAAQRLEQAEALARAAGVASHRLLMREPGVYQCILKAARQAGADLIVMGTRGMGSIERLFVGSQTQRVLAHTEIPVLVVH